MITDSKAIVLDSEIFKFKAERYKSQEFHLTLLITSQFVKVVPEMEFETSCPESHRDHIGLKVMP
jgi:hypothetical protein